MEYFLYASCSSSSSSSSCCCSSCCSCCCSCSTCSCTFGAVFYGCSAQEVILSLLDTSIVFVTYLLTSHAMPLLCVCQKRRCGCCYTWRRYATRRTSSCCFYSRSKTSPLSSNPSRMKPAKVVCILLSTRILTNMHHSHHFDRSAKLVITVGRKYVKSFLSHLGPLCKANVILPVTYLKFFTNIFLRHYLRRTIRTLRLGKSSVTL